LPASFLSLRRSCDRLFDLLASAHVWLIEGELRAGRSGAKASPELAAAAASALSHTLLVFDEFHDVVEKAQAGNGFARQVLESWANAEWFTSRPPLADKITVTVFKVPGETNTDDLSPAQDAWSRPDIPLHANAMLKNPREGLTEKPLEKIAELALKYDLCVLCDEAYFDIRYEGQSKSLVSLPGMAERCVILYTFSKKFVMTGWRLGAAIGPKEIIDIIIKLNVNEESCSNHFVQYAAIEGLTGNQAETRQILKTLKERRDLTVDLLNDIEGISCIRPNATFYLWPNVTGAMQKTGLTGYDDFRRTVLQETGVSFCTRLHFGRPLAGEDNYYIRLAYSGINPPEIREGLGKLKAFIES